MDGIYSNLSIKHLVNNYFICALPPLLVAALIIPPSFAATVASGNKCYRHYWTVTHFCLCEYQFILAFPNVLASALHVCVSVCLVSPAQAVTNEQKTQFILQQLEINAVNCTFPSNFPIHSAQMSFLSP